MMDTVRLRTIQQPTMVERLLESLVMSCIQPAGGVRRVLDRSELPGKLHRIAIRSKKSEHVWGAWTDDRRVWFYTAEMSMDSSRERGCPVLDVRSFDEEGQIRESGSWVRVRDGAWQRCSH
jgi:hypothetical protein